MKFFNLKIAALGLLGFIAGVGQSDTADAQGTGPLCLPNLTEEECCEAALSENTIEALEEFLRLYSDDTGESACRALALVSLRRFSEPRFNDDPPPVNGGYGG